MKENNETIFLQKTVTTIWHPNTKVHYEALGYKYTGKFSELTVSIFDLPNTSLVKVWVMCPDCKEKRQTAMQYVRKHKNTRCFKCAHFLFHFKNLENQKFGRLTVIRSTGKQKNQTLWECICDCGNTKITTVSSLTLGRTQSCGCLRTERLPSGENHYKWNHNFSKEEHLQARPAIAYGYRAWISIVKKRAGLKCEVCKKAENLQVHHLNSWADFPEQRTDPDNGVCLCPTCHRRFHSIYGRGKNTKEQFEDFVKRSCLK